MGRSEKKVEWRGFPGCSRFFLWRVSTFKSWIHTFPTILSVCWLIKIPAIAAAACSHPRRGGTAAYLRPLTVTRVGTCCCWDCYCFDGFDRSALLWRGRNYWDTMGHDEKPQHYESQDSLQHSWRSWKEARVLIPGLLWQQWRWGRAVGERQAGTARRIEGRRGEWRETVRKWGEGEDWGKRMEKLIASFFFLFHHPCLAPPPSPPPTTTHPQPSGVSWRGRGDSLVSSLFDSCASRGKKWLRCNPLFWPSAQIHPPVWKNHVRRKVLSGHWAEAAATDFSRVCGLCFSPFFIVTLAKSSLILLDARGKAIVVFSGLKYNTGTWRWSSSPSSHWAFVSIAH